MNYSDLIDRFVEDHQYHAWAEQFNHAWQKEKLKVSQTAMQTAYYTVNVTFLGMNETGKSTTALRICGEDFDPEYDPSIEDNYTKTCHFPGYGQVDLSILDTAGQEEYSSLDDQWIREGECYALFYSTDNKSTFEQVKTKYDKILRVRQTYSTKRRVGTNIEKGKVEFPVLLIGSRMDLEYDTHLDFETGEALAQEWGPHVKFIELSSKNNEARYRKGDKIVTSGILEHFEDLMFRVLRMTVWPWTLEEQLQVELYYLLDDFIREVWEFPETLIEELYQFVFDDPSFVLEIRTKPRPTAPFYKRLLSKTTI